MKRGRKKLGRKPYLIRMLPETHQALKEKAKPGTIGALLEKENLVK